MFVQFNPNPLHKRVGDCTVRALAKALDQDWYETYLELCFFGYMLCDMPSSNNVWGTYLKSKGFRRFIIPDDGINQYSAEDFCRDHPMGTFVLSFDSHVATVKDGKLYDSWESSCEIPIFYWEKRKDEEE